jgi:NADH-quinone oxidoreductase subunit C
MTAFAVNPETLKSTLLAVLGDKAKRVEVALGEVCVVVDAADYFEVANCVMRLAANLSS